MIDRGSTDDVAMPRSTSSILRSSACPASPTRIVLRGSLLSRRSARWAKCADDLAAAESAQPETSRRRRAHAHAHRSRRCATRAPVKLADAERIARRAPRQARRPNKASSYMRLGETRIALGKLDEAIDALDGRTRRDRLDERADALAARARLRPRAPPRRSAGATRRTRSATTRACRRSRRRVSRCSARATREYLQGIAYLYAMPRARVRPALLPPVPRRGARQPVAPPRRGARPRDRGDEASGTRHDRARRLGSHRHRGSAALAREGDAAAARLHREVPALRVPGVDPEAGPSHAR